MKPAKQVLRRIKRRNKAFDYHCKAVKHAMDNGVYYPWRAKYYEHTRARRSLS